MKQFFKKILLMILTIQTLIAGVYLVHTEAAVNSGDIRWDFDVDEEGFLPKDEKTVIETTSDGTIKVINNGDKDPNIYVEGLKLDPNIHKYLRFRMKNNSSSRIGEAYIYAGSIANRIKLSGFNIDNTSGEWKVYCVPIDYSVMDNGTAQDYYTGFRLDYTNNCDSGYVEIDYIVFSEYGLIPDENSIDVVNENGVEIEYFSDKTDGELYITARGEAVAGEDVFIIYAWYDTEGMCISINFKKIECSADGAYVLTASDSFKTIPPDNATTLKVFAFGGENMVYPLQKNITINKVQFDTQTVTTFDSQVYNYPLALVNEYPCMEIGNLATVIGGSTDGVALTKDDVSISFTEGNRLAEDNNGHLMLECKPIVYCGKLYVPISVVMPTLCYTMHYDRFGKTLDITTGTDYPDTEVVFYARDFGAVGDGVANDGPAILHTIYAALASGKPAKVELDANKTYLLGERVDNIGYFLLEDVENFTFDGKGSELIIEKCTNTFLDMHRCTNVKIQNLEVDYRELPFTQGRILSVDAENGTFLLDIDDGYPLPAVDEWVHYYYTDARTGKWWFGQIMDPVEDRMKFTRYDNIFIESVKHVEGRVYKLTVKNGYAPRLVCAEPGDRFVLNTRTSAYDVSDSTHERTPNMMIIQSSGDITIENVNIYASPWLGASIGLCWGKVNFRNFGLKTKQGRLLCINSDGLHVWRNRAGILVENSTFMNSLDDHINTKGEDGIMLRRIDDYTYEVDNDLNYRVGDELIFFDPVNHMILEKVFLKAFDQVSSAKAIITVDRKIDGIVSREDNTVRPTIVYNVSASSAGTVVRNNTFIYSRRHAYLSRSKNSIFENNKVIECGGGGLVATNEIGSASSEGPFPSSFTMRNNEIKGPGTTDGYYPVEVKSWDAQTGNSMAVDGLLMENNIIEVDTDSKMISIESTKDLYMLNNTIRSNCELASDIAPISIVNSEIALIDGMDFDYSSNVDYVISISGCKGDENNIKNIKVLSDNTAKEYVIK